MGTRHRVSLCIAPPAAAREICSNPYRIVILPGSYNKLSMPGMAGLFVLLGVLGILLTERHTQHLLRLCAGPRDPIEIYDRLLLVLTSPHT